MQKKIILFRFMAFVILSATLVFVSMNAPKAIRFKAKESTPSDKMYTEDETNSSSVYKLHEGKGNLECLYYNVLDFIGIKEFNFDEDFGTIRGLIVPHHLLAKDMIHEAFQAAAGYKVLEEQADKGVSNSKYKTIVVFGPDHESTNRGKVFTSSSSWQSPMGLLNADKDLIKILSELDFVEEDNEKMTIEHSISSLVTFIKYYFSDAQIVPLALTKQLTDENIDSLLNLLVDNLDIETTLFVSSVDFSHYLSLEEANEMDKISIEAITNKDIGRIREFTNDNLDSPNSVIAMLNTMELIGAKNTKVLNNSNLQIILNEKVDETTSYVTFLFYN